MTMCSWHSASCDKFHGMFDFEYLSAPGFFVSALMTEKQEVARKIAIKNATKSSRESKPTS